MSAQRRFEVGDFYFEVSYMPADKGQKIHEEDEWPGDHMETKGYSTFDAAIRFACKAALTDFFGCVQVTKQVCENPKYNWWGSEGIWEVASGDQPDKFNADEPTYTD